MIIDCQVHAYEADHPGRPWTNHLPGPPEVTGEQLVARMDAVGVDAAILVSVFTMYRYDSSYAEAVRKAFPQRIALVKPIDIKDPAVGEVVSEWAKTDGAIGIRIFEFPNDPADPGFNAAISAAARHSLAVNLLTFEHHAQVAAIAKAHPNCQFAIDHLGVRPPRAPPVHAEPFKSLPKVLEFAAHENIAIKVTGVCTLSAQPYPYNDIWDSIWRVFDAFGFDRCMWGSDWTRTAEFLTYKESVDAFRLHERLNESERAALMGGSARKIYGWPQHV